MGVGKMLNLGSVVDVKTRTRTVNCSESRELQLIMAHHHEESHRGVTPSLHQDTPPSYFLTHIYSADSRKCFPLMGC